jgi:hypothetical protein
VKTDAASRSSRLAQVVLAGTFLILLLVPMALRGLGAMEKPVMGFAAAAEEVWAQYNARNPVVLVVANGAGEGAAITELAMLDPHPPSLFAVRGSRIFGGGGYNSRDYLPRFEHPSQLMQEIDEYAIPLMILRRDPTGKEWAHIRQIEEAMTLYPERWRVISRNTAVTPEVLLVEIRGNGDKESPTAKLKALTGPKALN